MHGQLNVKVDKFLPIYMVAPFQETVFLGGQSAEPAIWLLAVDCLQCHLQELPCGARKAGSRLTSGPSVGG